MSDAARLEIEAIFEQAVNWLRILQTSGERQTDEFWKWMAASPAHVREVLLAQVLEDELCFVDSAHRIDVEALIARASLEPDTPIDPPQMPARSFLPWIAGIAACAALAIAAWMLWVYFGTPSGRDYATHEGELLSLQLQDGSIMNLNYESAAQVRFTAHACDIYMRGGEASFEVKQNSERPLRVHAANAVFQAIDSRFYVRLVSGRVFVSVDRGALQVSIEGGKESATVDASTVARMLSSEGVPTGANGAVGQFLPSRTALSKEKPGLEPMSKGRIVTATAD